MQKRYFLQIKSNINHYIVIKRWVEDTNGVKTVETTVQRIVDGANQLEKYYKSIGIEPNTSEYVDLFAILHDYRKRGLTFNHKINRLLLRFNDMNKHEQKLIAILNNFMSAENNDILLKSVESIEEYKHAISTDIMYLVCRDHSGNN